MSFLYPLALLLAAPVAAPAAPAESAVVEHPQVLAYSETADAERDVASALSQAKASGKIAVIILGANWCHDSIGLAGWLQTSRFAEMMRDRYVVTYVDVGVPQTKHGRNLDIAKRFGIKKLRSTPALLMVSGDGERLNDKDDAIGWRNAASRSEDEIYAYFAQFGETE